MGAEGAEEIPAQRKVKCFFTSHTSKSKLGGIRKQLPGEVSFGAIPWKLMLKTKLSVRTPEISLYA